jgi:hypothetical protein
MSAKRRLKKMKRQRRLAGRDPVPLVIDNTPKPGDPDYLDYLDDLKFFEDLENDDLDDDDLDDSSFFVQFDPITGAISAVPDPFAGDLPMSDLMGHIIRNDGLAADRLPAGALAKLLSENVCPTNAQHEAMTLRDGCEAWHRWPVGHGLYIDLKLYQDRGNLQIPESLIDHPEVDKVIGDVITEHYVQQPKINRVLRQQGAEAARALIDAIPIHLFSIED